MCTFYYFIFYYFITRVIYELHCKQPEHEVSLSYYSTPNKSFNDLKRITELMSGFPHHQTVVEEVELNLHIL